MSNQVFAFGVSRPLEDRAPIEFIYNPDEQIAEWIGGDSIKAIGHCTQAPYTGWKCNSMPGYCVQTYTGVYGGNNGWCD